MKRRGTDFYSWHCDSGLGLASEKKNIQAPHSARFSLLAKLLSPGFPPLAPKGWYLFGRPNKSIN